MLSAGKSSTGSNKKGNTKGSSTTSNNPIEEAKAKAAKFTACEDISGAYLVFSSGNLIGDSGNVASGAGSGGGPLSLSASDNVWLVKTKLLCVEQEQEECLVRGNVQIAWDLKEGDAGVFPGGPIEPGPFLLYDQFAGYVYDNELTYVESFSLYGLVGTDQAIMNFEQGSLRGVNIDTNQAGGSSTVGAFEGFFLDADKVDRDVLESYALDPEFCVQNAGKVVSMFGNGGVGMIDFGGWD